MNIKQYSGQIIYFPMLKFKSKNILKKNPPFWSCLKEYDVLGVFELLIKMEFEFIEHIIPDDRYFIHNECKFVFKNCTIYKDQNCKKELHFTEFECTQTLDSNPFEDDITDFFYASEGDFHSWFET